ncbi:MAG TPA: serine/threonine-protein kinase [Polyangiaceae bacterium]|nr:serine/threonine-protein kinase [Polyangiaceae bacterium]
MSWTVGLTLSGRFRLDAALGANSNPRVWAATHLPTGRRVAIRRLETPAALPPRGLGALVSELRSAAAIEHPNVTEVYEVVEGLDDSPLMISELLRGETLERKLSQHPMLSLRETASLLLPVVSAVGTAHARGIVHGGLSASSVFLWGGGGAVPAVKVLDFGLAKWMAAVEQAPASSRAGAPPSRRVSEYEPPELNLPGRAIDHRADIWALGIILYECLSGQRPRDFVPRDPDLAASAAFMPIDQRAPAVPRAVSDIIAHLLVSDPDHRAQNLIELFHALSPLAERPSPNFGWPGSERRISGLTQRLIAPERIAAAAPTPASDAASRVNWRTLALAATGLAGVELAAIAWLLLRSPAVPAPAESIVALNAAPASAPMASAEPHHPSESAIVSAQPQGPGTSSRAAQTSEFATTTISDRPPLMDDFEDGNAAPLAEEFGNWQSFTINPGGRALPLRLGPGYASRGSVEMEWMLDELLDGKAGRSGAGLRSTARAGVIDLSRRSRLTFAHRYAPVNTPGLECKGAKEFVVFVTCRALGEGFVPQFERTLPVSDVWTIASVELLGLTEATRGGSSPTNLSACLAATDSFGFRADASSDADTGGCDSGKLWFDDIGFQ